MIKKTLGERAFDLINVMILSLVVFITVYPIVYVLFSSVSEPVLLQRHTGLMTRPLGFTLKGYEMVLGSHDILISYANTILYVVSGTALNVLLTAMSAYVLSRKNLLWGGIMMKLVTFTMFFSGGLIPFYLIMKDMGMIDNRLVMILPGAISTWNLIIMRTSFLGLPPSLEESARIDGAGDFRILFNIILPVSKSIIAVMILFYAVSHWNAWFNAMVFLRSREKYPLQLILREILLSNDTGGMMTNLDTGGASANQYQLLVQYSTIIVATMPVLMIYPFVQKYFIKGVLVGSVKG